MSQKTAIRLLLVTLVAFVSMGSLACGYPPDADPQRNAEAIVDFSPAWSPDGEFIITYAGYGLHGVRTDGSQAWQIRKRKRDFLSSPDISVDGRLAFQSRRANSWVRNLLETFAFPKRQEHRIEMVDVDVERAGRVTSTEVGFRRNLAWSPDGQLLAYRSRGLVFLDRTGNQVGEFDFFQPYRGHMEGFEGLSVKQFAWSPSSDRLAVVAWSNSDGAGDALVMVDIDGSPPEIIFRAEEGIVLSAPAWSPDGETIFYITRPIKPVRPPPESIPLDLQSIFPDGSGRRVLANLGDDAAYRRALETAGMRIINEEIHVCPNEKSLLLVTRGVSTHTGFRRYYAGGQVSLHVANMDTGELDRITYEQDALFASWSPDCSRIAVASPHREDVMLYTMNADGSDPQVLLERNERGKIQPGHSRPLQDE